jgi:hypothetical protein
MPQKEGKKEIIFISVADLKVVMGAVEYIIFSILEECLRHLQARRRKEKEIWYKQ